MVAESLDGFRKQNRVCTTILAVNQGLLANCFGSWNSSGGWGSYFRLRKVGLGHHSFNLCPGQLAHPFILFTTYNYRSYKKL